MSAESDPDNRSQIIITCAFPDGTSVRMKQPGGWANVHGLLDEIIDLSVDHLHLAERPESSAHRKIPIRELLSNDAF